MKAIVRILFILAAVLLVFFLVGIFVINILDIQLPFLSNQVEEAVEQVQISTPTPTPTTNASEGEEIERTGVFECLPEGDSDDLSDAVVCQFGLNVDGTYYALDPEESIVGEQVVDDIIRVRGTFISKDDLPKNSKLREYPIEGKIEVVDVLEVGELD